MVDQNLAPSPVLDVRHFNDFEQFCPSDILGLATSIPHDHRSFSVARATLALPGSRLMLQRSFARHFEGDVGADGCGVAVPMSPDYHYTANGRFITNNEITLLRGNIPGRIVEFRPNTNVLIRLSSTMQMRGWADFGRGAAFFPSTPMQLRHLQSVVQGIVESAASCIDAADFALRAEAMQETLYAALDDSLVLPDAIRARPRSFNHHRRIAARLDDLIRDNPAAALYSDHLARSLGASVRTLQVAMREVHGVSLHRYIRMKRLWKMRSQLSRAVPGVSVKAVAYANGFWHMGELSRSYKATFGELPSETLSRASGVRR